MPKILRALCGYLRGLRSALWLIEFARLRTISVSAKSNGNINTSPPCRVLPFSSSGDRS
jgi:hypothetical protein